MPVFATDLPRLSALIKNLDTLLSPELFQDVVQVNTSAATKIVLGQVMGSVAATGKWVVAVLADVDTYDILGLYVGTGDALGSPVPTTTVADVDSPVLVLTRGKAVVSADAIVYDPSFATAVEKAAVNKTLKAQGVLVSTTV